MRRISMIAALALLLVACAHTTDAPPAFTDTWYDKTRDVMAEEKARKQAQEVLLGDEDDAVTVRADEKGRPKVQVGKDRIHADVDVKSGDPRVRLRYKLKWRPGKKDMPETVPRISSDSKSPAEENKTPANGD